MLRVETNTLDLLRAGTVLFHTRGEPISAGRTHPSAHAHARSHFSNGDALPFTRLPCKHRLKKWDTQQSCRTIMDRWWQTAQEVVARELNEALIFKHSTLAIFRQNHDLLKHTSFPMDARPGGSTCSKQHPRPFRNRQEPRPAHVTVGHRYLLSVRSNAYEQQLTKFIQNIMQQHSHVTWQWQVTAPLPFRNP